MKYLIAALAISIMLIGHVIHGLHMSKTSGQMEQAMEVVLTGGKK